MMSSPASLLADSPSEPTLPEGASQRGSSSRPSAAHTVEVCAKQEQHDPNEDETPPQPHLAPAQPPREHVVVAPQAALSRPAPSPERLLFAQFERLTQQKAQVDQAFESAQHQLCECAGLVHQYMRRLHASQDTNGTRAAVEAEAAPSCPVRPSPAVLSDATVGDDLTARCLASTEKAIEGTELLFRFLFERLYLHQLAANADFADDFERALKTNTPASAAQHASWSTSPSLWSPSMRSALDSLRRVPNTVQRFQAECQRVQLASPSTDSSSALMATLVFAVSAQYDAKAQQEIVTFLHDTLHVAALVLPAGVPEVELALWMHCRFLVSPTTVMTSPLLSMPRERMELVYRFSRQCRDRSVTSASAVGAATTATASHVWTEQSGALSPSATEPQPPCCAEQAGSTSHASPVAVQVQDSGEEGPTDSDLELAAVADADAELLELLQLLDAQQHPHGALERPSTPAASLGTVDGSRSPFPQLPSPSCERSLTFPPTLTAGSGAVPRPEDSGSATLTASATVDGTVAAQLPREDSLSNTTAFSQTSQTGIGATLSQEPHTRRSRPTTYTIFTRHRQYTATGAADDGLGRMSASTQPAPFFSYPRKRSRQGTMSASQSHAPLSQAPRVPSYTPQVCAPSTLTASSSGHARIGGEREMEAEEEEPVVVVASQQTVVESQRVTYNHGARHSDYKPMDEEDGGRWYAPVAEADEESSESTSSMSRSRGALGGEVSHSHSDGDNASLHPYARPLRDGGAGASADDDVSVGFASVHNPLDGAVPLMLPGTAAAMHAPSSRWRFQISNSVREQRATLVDLITKLGGEVDLGSAFNPATTHLITAEGLTERTEKYLSACAAGILVVPPRCVTDSAQRGHWVHGQKMLEYNMNPCRRFLSYPSEFHGLPFAHWRVLLLAGHASVAKGIRTVLHAGGCPHISVLVFDDQSQPPSVQEPSVAAAVAACANVPLTLTMPPANAPPTERHGLNPLSPIDPALVRASTHVLVECAQMSTRAPGTFQLPAWFPVALMRHELYPRLFTLEILYHSLCSSLEPVFRPSTGELLSEDALIPACRVEPFC